VTKMKITTSHRLFSIATPLLFQVVPYPASTSVSQVTCGRIGKHCTCNHANSVTIKLSKQSKQSVSSKSNASNLPRVSVTPEKSIVEEMLFWLTESHLQVFVEVT
jgi:hypothetical protein